MNQNNIYEIDLNELKSIKQIPVTLFDSHFESKYNNLIANIKKVLFFIFNEDIKLTCRKIRS